MRVKAHQSTDFIFQYLRQKQIHELKSNTSYYAFSSLFKKIYVDGNRSEYPASNRYHSFYGSDYDYSIKKSSKLYFFDVGNSLTTFGSQLKLERQYNSERGETHLLISGSDTLELDDLIREKISKNLKSDKDRRLADSIKANFPFSINGIQGEIIFQYLYGRETDRIFHLQTGTGIVILHDKDEVSLN